MLDDRLLADYMNGFWGYGSLDADFWFVGMEEGGGDSVEEIRARLAQWDGRGRQALEDLYEYHESIGGLKWFRTGAPLQSTWNRLIRVLMSAKAIVPDREDVRNYQIKKLGRRTGETCLLELLPLPSPSTSHWLYGEHSRLPVLESRTAYRDGIGPVRAARLQQLIKTHQPRIVMFYGMAYLGQWRQVASTELAPSTVCNKSVYFGKVGETSIAVAQHPVATGVTLEYFHEVGKQLAAEVA